MLRRTLVTTPVGVEGAGQRAPFPVRLATYFLSAWCPVQKCQAPGNSHHFSSTSVCSLWWAFSLFSSAVGLKLDLWEGLLEEIAGPISGVSASVGLGWGVRICIPSAIPGDAHVVAMETPL